MPAVCSVRFACSPHTPAGGAAYLSQIYVSWSVSAKVEGAEGGQVTANTQALSPASASIASGEYVVKAVCQRTANAEGEWPPSDQESWDLRILPPENLSPSPPDSGNSGGEGTDPGGEGGGGAASPSASDGFAPAPPPPTPPPPPAPPAPAPSPPQPSVEVGYVRMWCRSVSGGEGEYGVAASGEPCTSCSCTDHETWDRVQNYDTKFRSPTGGDLVEIAGSNLQIVHRVLVGNQPCTNLFCVFLKCQVHQLRRQDR